jgi:hypothetical protein
VTEIQHSASNGIQVGAGQNGGMARQSGLPAGLAAEVARIGHDVFTFAYVEAMRSTMILPVVLLAVGALSCLALRERKPPAVAASQAAVAPAVADAGEADIAVTDAAVEPSTRPAG